jgi:ornithine cyclodeaminase/alanine dehydrogenase-like protein (mu-crystallin family)
MAERNVRLTARDLLSALAATDSLTPCAEELVARVGPAAGRRPHVPAGPELTELVLAENGSRTRYLLPSAELRASRAAALAGVAARALLTPGVVTAAVLGSGPDAQPQLMMIARYVPAVSHIAVCPVSAERSSTVNPRVLDQIAEAGIGLTLNSDVQQTLFGANLVVATAQSPGPVRFPELTKGALLVNASGADLPNDVVDRVDRIYADAPDLMADHRDRYFVRRHFHASAARGPLPPSSSGLVAHPPGIVVGLGDVLSGVYRSRVGADEIRLVELLSAGEPDLGLAAELCRTARLLSLGASYGHDVN